MCAHGKSCGFFDGDRGESSHSDLCPVPSAMRSHFVIVDSYFAKETVAVIFTRNCTPWDANLL